MKLYINTKQLAEINVCINEEIELHSVSILKQPQNNSLIFINKKSKDVDNIKNIKNSLIIAYLSIFKDYDELLFSENIVFLIDNPRLCFIKVLTKMVNYNKIKNYETDFLDLGFSRYVHKNTKIHDSVIIEANVTIDSNVEINKGSIISSGSHIKENVIIGEDCFIGSGTVIGNQGFGAERDHDDKIYMMPHIGGVIIKNRVVIGCNTTIVAGTITPTVIANEVKIDDLVLVAHNCNIEKSVIICGGSFLGGSVSIGEKCWIGIGSIVHQSTIIEANATLGIGSVVRRNVKQGTTVIGNPAQKLSKHIELTRKLRKL